MSNIYWESTSELREGYLLGGLVEVPESMYTEVLGWCATTGQRVCRAVVVDSTLHFIIDVNEVAMFNYVFRTAEQGQTAVEKAWAEVLYLREVNRPFVPGESITYPDVYGLPNPV